MTSFLCPFELFQAGEGARASRLGLLRQEPRPFDPGLDLDNLVLLLVSGFLEGAGAFELLLNSFPELSELLKAGGEARMIFLGDCLGSLPSGLSFL